MVLNNNLGILTTPNNTITLNEWQHIAFVFNDAADSVKIFRNGIEVAGARYTGTITGGSHNFTLSESGVEKFGGAMDEVRIWNVARTQAQIQANMSTTVSTSSSGLVAYYGFNQGTAGGTNTGVTTLTDLTSNALNGTLYNFTLSGTSSNWVTSTAISTLSNNANLSALTTTAGTLSPTFSASTTAYTASVNNATTSVTVTPTRAEANATILVRVNNGTYSPVTSGSASAALALNVGSNTIDVRVTAQDGSTIKTYTITVTRASSISSNADLSGLTISAGTLNPTFNSSNTSYSVSVDNASSTVTVTPTRAESNATIQVRVNGGSYSTVTSGTASGNLAVNVGSNTIDVLVTAQDGTTTKTYSIQVIRAQSSNANLTALTISSGTLSPTFTTNTTSYTATVSNATNEISLTATQQEVNAGSNVRVVVNGGAASFITSGVASSNLSLNIGSNTILVIVTAEDAVTTKTYTITVTRTALAPAITSFTPLAATPGDVVVISGAHFNTTTTNNIVYFGATAATVTDATATSLTVQVPQGATFAPISILNTSTSLVGTSLQKFNPVFSPAKSAFSSTDLASKVDFTAGSSPRGCAFADIDGDGKAEIIVTNFSANNVGVFRNTSNGSGAVTYATMVTFPTGNSTLAVVINDMDNDGKLDIVTLNLSGSISVLRNTSTSGSISFATKVDATVGVWPLGIAVGDVDGDGKADIVTANYNDNNFSIVRNTSTSGSISLATHTTFSTGSGPASVAISDIDGNGVVDVVIGNQDNANVSVFRNTSSVGSLSFAARVNFNTAASPVWIATGDIDNDGKLDIVSANQGAKSISILRNTSTSGTVTFATKIDVATDPATSAVPNFIALGDMNGDNKLDVVVSIDGIDKVSVFRSTSTSGNISFDTCIDFSTGSNPWSVAVGDADNDGKSDIAVVNRVSNSFSILRNTDIPVWNGTSWSPSAPSSTADAIIASSTAPSSFTAKGLTINSGVSLNINGINATIHGDINNNGNGITGTGNLIIASSSVLQGNPIAMEGTLTVNAGTLTTNG
ncbi:MAG TPA: hypothetical protein DCL43_08385, partial [Chitinophagaceae bacterium]|nr:hypothetical protein [Chitinophagaceae bacterium]